MLHSHPLYRILRVLFAALLVSSLTFASGLGDPQSRHVLIIGIDGVRPDALQDASTPNLTQLAWEGRTSWQAIAGGGAGDDDPTRQATSSGPGWSSILTGVWVDKHGVVNNAFENNNLKQYPHLFARIRDARPDAQLASIVHWNPINDHLLKPFPGLANHIQETASDLEVETAAHKYLLEANPDVLFLHFDEVDGAGHKDGYGSDIQKYLEAIEKVDGHVGKVLAALQERPNYAAEDWLVLVTTDHGGIDKGHGGQSIDERTIWLIAHGKNVAPGTLPNDLGHTTIAPTALQHLGIERPNEWGMVDALALSKDQLKTEVDVMSFNIRYGTANDGENSWPKRNHLVMDVIRDNRPDILGVQEALRFQLDEIRAQFPNYAIVGVGRDDGKQKGEYAAILYDCQRFEVYFEYTYWLSSTPDEVASKSFGNRIPRICTVAFLRDRHTQGSLTVHNVHWDHESQPSREASAKLLKSQISAITNEVHWGQEQADAHSHLVLGDFNSGEQNPAFTYLLKSNPLGLRDSFRVLHPDEKDVGTFNAFQNKTTGQKIDAVLIDKTWTVLKSGIHRSPKGQPNPSDHFPVWARLRFNKQDK
ncbi:MAG: endonuclease/exonuclease/phosphatase family metal-dependent hydrolase [Planctomycetota bacterium]|jgi:endonuclease/exonuclease/phosphatase family metal-dependent hydrolase